MPQTTLTLRGGLSPELVDQLRGEVMAQGQALAVSPALLPIAALVVEEICTNIMEHSNASWLELSLERQGARVWVRIRDDGRAFDPCQAIVAQGSLRFEEVQDRRLGLYMVGQLASSARYRRDEQGHNRVDFEFDPQRLDGGA